MHRTIDQNPQQKAASDRASSIPLEQFNPGDPELFRTDTFWPYFDRLRQEDPVHYCEDSTLGECVLAPSAHMLRADAIEKASSSNGAYNFMWR
jgi:hypothetical protein